MVRAGVRYQRGPATARRHPGETVANPRDTFRYDEESATPMPNTSAKSAKAIRAAAKSAPGGAVNGASGQQSGRRIPWWLIGAAVVIVALVVLLVVYLVPKSRHHADKDKSNQSPTGQMDGELPAGIPAIPGIPGLPEMPGVPGGAPGVPGVPVPTG